MLSGFAYMLQTITHQRSKLPSYIHFIVAEHGVEFCESLLTVHVLTGCHSTTSLNWIGKCVANTKLQDLMENADQSFTTFGIQENVDIDVSSVRLFILSLYVIKARNCSLLNQLQYFLFQSNLLHTWHQQKMPSNSTSSEQDTRTTSNITVISKLWTLILLSATDDIHVRLMVSLNQGHIPKVQL